MKGTRAGRQFPLLNPLSEEYAVLRTQLVSSMLNVMATNYSRKNPQVRLFEIASRFVPKALPVTEQPEELPTLRDVWRNGRLFYPEGRFGKPVFRFWPSHLIMQRIRSRICIRAARRLPAWRARRLRYSGELHPETFATRYGFEGRVYVAEAYLDRLYALADDSIAIFKPMPKYPAVERDLALLCDEATPGSGTGENSPALRRKPFGKK